MEDDARDLLHRDTLPALNPSSDTLHAVARLLPSPPPMTRRLHAHARPRRRPPSWSAALLILAAAAVVACALLLPAPVVAAPLPQTSPSPGSAAAAKYGDLYDHVASGPDGASGYWVDLAVSGSPGESGCVFIRDDGTRHPTARATSCPTRASSPSSSDGTGGKWWLVPAIVVPAAILCVLISWCRVHRRFSKFERRLGIHSDAGDAAEFQSSTLNTVRSRRGGATSLLSDDEVLMTQTGQPRASAGNTLERHASSRTVPNASSADPSLQQEPPADPLLVNLALNDASAVPMAIINQMSSPAGWYFVVPDRSSHSVAVDGHAITFYPFSPNSKRRSLAMRPTAVVTSLPVPWLPEEEALPPRSLLYFEVTITALAPATNLVVGLATVPYPPHCLPGRHNWSVGLSAFPLSDMYHGGSLPRLRASQKQLLRLNDVVGVAIDTLLGHVRYTVNGRLVPRSNSNSRSNTNSNPNANSATTTTLANNSSSNSTASTDDDIQPQHTPPVSPVQATTRLPAPACPIHPCIGADGPCQVTVNFGTSPFVWQEANDRHSSFALDVLPHYSLTTPSTVSFFAQPYEDSPHPSMDVSRASSSMSLDEDLAPPSPSARRPDSGVFTPPLPGPLPARIPSLSVRRSRVLSAIELDEPPAYRCPRCGIRYCSLACYKSAAHDACADQFKLEEAITDMTAKPGEVDDRKLQETVVRALKNLDLAEDGMDEDEAEDPDSAQARFSDITLESATPEQILARMTPAERQRFEQLLERDALPTALTELIPLWEPWWTGAADKRPKVQILDPEEPELEPSEPTEPSPLPPLPAAIPPMFAHADPADPSLAINLLEILFAYVTAARLMNGELGVPGSNCDDACEVVWTVSRVLGTNEAFAYSDVEEFVEHAVHVAMENPTYFLSVHRLPILLRDVLALVTPLTSTHPLRALEHLRLMFQGCLDAAKRRAKAALTDASALAMQKLRRRAFLTEKKVAFYLALAKWSAVNPEILAPLVIDLTRAVDTREADAREIAEAAAQVRRVPQTKTSKVLIQEL
ncbi:hypothetical protein H9P43_001453 [Blastocladiella emersonii ATCC 22665]|nr:hypothetical protein H9P43_001453 [Blastocladiella emersonii ATCC 22665]